ncbi:MAG TPA: hypothetical protein VGI43_12700 [Mucilaginibacter sp.]|jgi:hypothetical protein
MKKINRLFRKFFPFLYMEKTLYYLILEKLDKAGIGTDFNLRPFIANYLKDRTNYKNNDRDKGWNEILGYINLIKKNKHIEYDETQLGQDEFLSSSQVVFNVRLTYIGAEYFNGLLIARNTIANFKITQIIATGALLFSAISVLYTFLTYNQNRDLERRIKSLEGWRISSGKSIKTQQVSIPITIDTVRLGVKTKP